jgi:sugar phosphate isomerase/epimerase
MVFRVGTRLLVTLIQPSTTFRLAWVTALATNDAPMDSSQEGSDIRMRLGIDSFSVRSQGWDAFQVLDYAAKLGLDNVHFSERAHLGSLDPAELAKIHDYARERDVTLEVGMRSFNKFSATFDVSLGTGEQQLLDMLEAANIVDSPIVRCFVGMQSDRSGPHSVEQLIEETIRTLKAVAPQAEAAGIAIAVENHGMGDLLAPELRDVIEAVGSTHVRVCLDTGNPVYAAEDAVYATEVLAPYTVSTHLRDTRAWLTPTGAMVQWVPAGRGSVDLPRIIAILQDQAPNVPIDLEVITGMGPKDIPFLDPAAELWTLYPEMKASAFARFLAMAGQSEPGPIDQIVLPTGAGQVPPEQLAAYLQQQLDHFEESVTYCRDFLGIA